MFTFVLNMLRSNVEFKYVKLLDPNVDFNYEGKNFLRGNL